jgi:hypothetical protein
VRSHAGYTFAEDRRPSAPKTIRLVDQEICAGRQVKNQDTNWTNPWEFTSGRTGQNGAKCDSSGERGGRVPAGVHYYRIRAGSSSERFSIIMTR